MTTKSRLAFSMQTDAAGDSAEIKLYAEVGESFWFESVSAKEFTDELDELDVSQITLRINSPGGSVFDGVAMYEALKAHPATVTAVVEGLSASIATVVMLAADEVQIGDASMVMIHNPWGFAMGEAADMRKTADTLDKLRDTILGVYARKTGKPNAEIADAMDAETWFSAEEALAFGLVDRVLGAGDDEEAAESLDDQAARAAFDQRAFEGFDHAPRALRRAYAGGRSLRPAARAGRREQPKAAGRVLSAANRDELESAIESIQNVLDADSGTSDDSASALTDPVASAAGAGTIPDETDRAAHEARLRAILTD